MCVTLTPNTLLDDLRASLSPFEHPRPESIVFYLGKFQIHANGCRVAEVACPVHAACQQKGGPEEEGTHAHRTHGCTDGYSSLSSSTLTSTFGWVSTTGIYRD